MPLKKNRGPLGSDGEDIAAGYLQAKGLKIIYRNYKTPVGEADIVARDGETIVFVEVKTRSNERYGEPFESVTSRKREKLKKIALYYQKHNNSRQAVRFDVISIKLRDSGPLIEHIEEAF